MCGGLFVICFCIICLLLIVLLLTAFVLSVLINRLVLNAWIDALMLNRLSLTIHSIDDLNVCLMVKISDVNVKLADKAGNTTTDPIAKNPANNSIA